MKKEHVTERGWVDDWSIHDAGNEDGDYRADQEDAADDDVIPGPGHFICASDPGRCGGCCLLSMCRNCAVLMLGSAQNSILSLTWPLGSWLLKCCCLVMFIVKITIALFLPTHILSDVQDVSISRHFC